MKLKFLTASLPDALDIIFVKLSACRVNIDVAPVSTGFEISRLDSKHVLSGKFIVRRVVESIVLDSDGNEIESQNVTYENFSFRLLQRDGLCVFCLFDPPRGLKLFIQTLAKQLGFGFSVTESSFNVTNIISFLERSTVVEVVNVSRAKLINISLTSSSLASMEIRSQKNAVIESEEFLKGKTHLLDRVAVEVFYRSTSVKVEVSRSGLLVWPKFIMDDFESVMQIVGPELR